MGNEKLIRYLNDVKYSFNSYTMNQTALILGAEAVKDRAYFEETCRKVIETREWTKKNYISLDFPLAIPRVILFCKARIGTGRGYF